MPVDPKTFLLVHVLISVVGILSGLVVVGGLMAGVRFGRWVALFLATTALTSLTGFGFPLVKLLPSHAVGAVSLVVLAGAAAALYLKRLQGAWRPAFVVLSVIALYLNVFVLLVQLFQKIPAMAMLAPTPGAPASAAAHLVVLALFVLIGRSALKGFHGVQAGGSLGARAVPAAR